MIRNVYRNCAFKRFQKKTSKRDSFIIFSHLFLHIKNGIQIVVTMNDFNILTINYTFKKNAKNDYWLNLNILSNQ